MHSATCTKEQQERTAALQAKVDELKRKLREREDALNAVWRKIIELWHHVAKDDAQILMDRLAQIANRQTTTQSDDYGLTRDD
ncbi:uncharacterized protein B0H18DRAFT_344415 [Fomitopsis serialis]|uniref:uncharacterized protein n=1 Tax=Fomitopsis serialis TaxID=139415 RepID=UPI002008E0EB|nr:uncharacterized protein B0H18DRAFT_344415 [Neoantrodia serialis]KAH9926491.1 hypothetical protein B0H18DRAFT_344415 [Neoantrodia serialis]